jgi:hypothetical protein
MPSSNLPVEIILLILEDDGFSYNDLRSCRGINKSWCNVATPIAFRHLDLDMSEACAKRLYRLLVSDEERHLRSYLQELIVIEDDKCLDKSPGPWFCKVYIYWCLQFTVTLSYLILF